jgi:steroid delta-isomerase-like uncharacterized protein
MSNGKKNFVERLFAAWNSRNIEQVLEHYDDVFVREDLGNHQTYSKEDLRKTVKTYTNAFPDIQFEVEKVIEKGEQVVVCWGASGHHKGKIMKIPATGKFVSFKGVSVLEIKNNRIVKVWYIWDEAGMLRQMGMLTELRQAI